MSDKKREYDSTIARMAGNIAAGYVGRGYFSEEHVVEKSVKLARLIVAEVKRTEPPTPEASA